LSLVRSSKTILRVDQQYPGVNRASAQQHGSAHVMQERTQERVGFMPS